MSASLLFAVIIGTFAYCIGPSGRGSYWFRAYDFQALYCGGSAALQHVNPYLVEPMRSCEHERPDETFKNEIPAWVVMPAPYPGYAFALYEQIARPPYAVSKSLWLAVLAFALGIGAVALAELTGISIVVIALVFVPTGLLTNLFLGSAPPIALAGLSLAALLYAREKAVLSVVPLSFAMINPHLALPSIVALFIAAPKARAALLVMIAALATISIATIGLDANVQYLRSVLPTHARAEVFHHYQYSLTHLLAVLGVGPTIALDAGTASYALLAILATYLVTGTVRSAQDRARVILVPAAIVSLGGNFNHDQEILLALPALFVLIRDHRSPVNSVLANIGFLGLLFCLVSLDLRIGNAAYIAASAAIGYLIWIDRRVMGALRSGLTACVLVFAVHSLPGAHPTPIPLPNAMRIEPPGITARTDAGIVWSDFIGLSPSWTVENAFTIALKISTWVGLLSVVVLAARIGRGTRLEFGEARGRMTTSSQPLLGARLESPALTDCG